MTDHDGLLRAICDHPDDDTPRLIFADWLEENGQLERAHFIRSDVTTERLDAYDPARLRWELIEKPRLTAFNSPLVAALSRLPRGCVWPHKLLFRRGFPCATSCEAPQSWSLLAAGVYTSLPLTYLTLHWQRSHPFAAVLEACWPSRIAGLEIHNAEIDRTEAARFVASPLAAGLRELHLHQEPFRADALRLLVASPVFARLSALSVVSTQQGRVEADAISGSGAGEIRRFHFASSRPPDVGRLLASLAFRHLESLKFGRLNAEGAQQLVASLVLKSLTVLDLAYTCTGDNNLGVILGQPRLSGLRSLNLTSTGMNSARVEQLAASPTFANLRALHLGSNSLGNAGAVAIAQSPHLAGLRVLNLSYSQVGDDGFRAILESPLADGLVWFKADGSPASAEMKQAVREKFGDRVIL